MIQLEQAKAFFDLIDLIDDFNSYVVGKGLSTDEKGIVWIPIEDIHNFVHQFKKK